VRERSAVAGREGDKPSAVWPCELGGSLG
jgi:hypothetical protein